MKESFDVRWNWFGNTGMLSRTEQYTHIWNIKLLYLKICTNKICLISQRFNVIRANDYYLKCPFQTKFFAKIHIKLKLDIHQIYTWVSCTFSLRKCTVNYSFKCNNTAIFDLNNLVKNNNTSLLKKKIITGNNNSINNKN